MIESIKIKNYLTCKNIKISFKQPLMALIGKNAAGKTNTLKGIEHACHWWTLVDIPEQKKSLIKDFSAEFLIKHKKVECIYSYKFYGKKNYYIKDSLSILKNGKEKISFQKKSKSTISIYFENEEHTFEIPYEFSGLRFLVNSRLPYKDNPELIKNISRYINTLRHLSLDLIRVKYHSQQVLKINSIYLKNYIDWLENSIYESEDELFGFKFYDFYHNENDLFNEYVEILKLLNIIDDIVIDTIQINKKTDSIITFYFVQSDTDLMFDSLSDGTKKIIIFLFHFFSKVQSIMLIEEPENSIHWGLLEDLLSVLDPYVDDNKKILFSTHSPQILNLLNPDQIVYLRNIDGVTKTKYLNDKAIKRVNKFLNEVGPLGEYATSGCLEEAIS